MFFPKVDVISSSQGVISSILALGKSIETWVFSFEFFFAFFLFIGVFKESPRLSWVPFDLTLFGFIASLLTAFWIFVKKGFVFPRFGFFPVFGFITFCGWAVLSLLWSASSDYGGSKAALLGILGLWSFLGGGIIIGSNRERLGRFCEIVILMSVWILIEVTMLILNGEMLRDLDWGNQYLSQGRLVGLGVLCLLGIWEWGNRGALAKFGLLLLIITFLIFLLVLGGRGPLLAVFAAMGVGLFRGIRLKTKGLVVRTNILIILLIVTIVATWFYTSDNMYFNSTTLDRLGKVFGSGGEGSANMRFWLYGQSLEYWQTEPLVGHGLGSFGILLGVGDVKIYPHNIFLEILVELGLVGLILFLSFMYLSIRSMKISLIRLDPYVAFVAMLFVNTFLNAMVSSDLSGNRVLYFSLGLAVGISWKSLPGKI